MKQRTQATTRSANDNQPSHDYLETVADGQGVSHLYVQKPKKHDPKNTSQARAQSTSTPTVIYTDLPQSLPVLPEEIALIRGFMGDLAAGILANDNEPQ